MDIPPFINGVDLPAGIYPATLQEAVERFGKSTTRREAVAARLERIYRVACETGYLRRFVVFGSFVTAKPEPNDVDVFMMMDDDFHSGTMTGEARLLFDHVCGGHFLRRERILDSETGGDRRRRRRDRALADQA